MRVLRVAAIFGFGGLFVTGMFVTGLFLAGMFMGGLTGPARAQQLPNINLLADGPTKTPEEREADEAKEKAYKESLKKIPDAKGSSDPWGGVRNADAPKTPAAKTTASAKPKAKTGGNAN